MEEGRWDDKWRVWRCIGPGIAWVARVRNRGVGAWLRRSLLDLHARHAARLLRDCPSLPR